GADRVGQHLGLRSGLLVKILDPGLHVLGDGERVAGLGVGHEVERGVAELADVVPDIPDLRNRVGVTVVGVEDRLHIGAGDLILLGRGRQVGLLGVLAATGADPGAPGELVGPRRARAAGVRRVVAPRFAVADRGQDGLELGQLRHRGYFPEYISAKRVAWVRIE